MNNDDTTPGAGQEQRSQEPTPAEYWSSELERQVKALPIGSVNIARAMEQLRDDALAQLRQSEAERREWEMKAAGSEFQADLARQRQEQAQQELRTLRADLCMVRESRDKVAAAKRQAEAEREQAIETSEAAQRLWNEATSIALAAKERSNELAAELATLRADRDRANLQAFTAQTEIYGLQAECDRLKAALEEFAAPSHWAYTNSAAEKNRPVFLSIRSVRDIAAEALAAPASTAAPEQSQPEPQLPTRNFDTESNREIWANVDKAAESAPEWIRPNVAAAVAAKRGSFSTQPTPDPIEEPPDSQPPGETTGQRLVLAEQARAMIEAWKAGGNDQVVVHPAGHCDPGRDNTEPNFMFDGVRLAAYPINSPQALIAVEAMLRAQKEKNDAE